MPRPVRALLGRDAGDPAYADAVETMACNMMDPSALDGVQAFIDKRALRP